MNKCMQIILFCLFCLLTLGVACFMFNTVIPQSEGGQTALNIRMATQRQFAWLAVGVVLMWQVARLDYHRWRDWSISLWVFVGCALALCLMSNPLLQMVGWTRWLGIGPLAFCPSRWAPVALALLLATLLSSDRPAAEKRGVDAARPGTITVLMEMGLPLAIVAFTAILVTGHGALTIRILLLLTALCVAIAARNAKVSYGLLLLGAAGFVAFLLSEPYRLQSFLSDIFNHDNGPHSVPLSLICIKTGGWFGIGLGQSTNRTFIPNATEMSEFMTAFIWEELGLICALMIAALMLTLLAAGLYLSLHAQDRFGKLLAAGVTSLLGFQALLHFAMLLNWISFIGIPMPFVSEIGSNACVSMFCAGLLLSVARQTARSETKREN